MRQMRSGIVPDGQATADSGVRRGFSRRHHARMARARLAQSVEHQTFKAHRVKGSEGQGFKSLIGRTCFRPFNNEDPEHAKPFGEAPAASSESAVAFGTKPTMHGHP